MLCTGCIVETQGLSGEFLAMLYLPNCVHCFSVLFFAFLMITDNLCPYKKCLYMAFPSVVYNMQF